MRRNKTTLFVHFVWATWDRLPLIQPNLEERLYRNICASAVALGCRVLAINGDRDHVHVLLTLPSTITIADLVKKMKGTSSRFLNDQCSLPVQFKWQGSYGAFSVSRWDVQKIIDYINAQKEHHSQGTTWEEFEQSVVIA